MAASIRCKGSIKCKAVIPVVRDLGMSGQQYEQEARKGISVTICLRRVRGWGCGGKSSEHKHTFNNGLTPIMFS